MKTLVLNNLKNLLAGRCVIILILRHDNCMTTVLNIAKSRGITIADTKFEFSLDLNNESVLVNEMLTPDSSRFWNLSNYEINNGGHGSYNRQFLRNWLTSNRQTGVENVTVHEDIVEKSYEALTWGNKKYL